MNSDSFVEKLKKRKVIQWSLAYVAAAWVTAQVAEVVAEPWGLPLYWIRFLHVGLAAGLLLVLTLAWFHGDRGHQRIQRTEAVLLVLILAGGAFSMSAIDLSDRGVVPEMPSGKAGPLGGVSATVPRLAVLAFSNLGKAEDVFFADGITAELGSRLSGLSGLALLSPSSAKAYKGSGQTPRQFGQSLGADYVLSGTVQWSRSGPGDASIRVIPEVIRVADDTQVWSSHFDQPFEDALTIQEDIAVRVVEELRVTMSESERVAVSSGLTSNPLAYEVYLKGIHALPGGHGAESDFRKARRLFEQAVALDPGFTEAWAALSDADKGLYWFGYDTTPSRLAMARASIERAMELEPDSHAARFQLADFFYRQRNYDEALVEFSSLFKERPNDAAVMQYMGYLWRRQGLFEQGIDALERASRLDPLNSYLLLETAWTHTHVGNIERAREMIEQSRVADPNEDWVYLIGVMVCWSAGGPDALPCARGYLEQFPRPRSVYPAWFWMLQLLMEGNPQQALELMKNYPEPVLLMQARYLPIEQVRGELLLALGRADEARPLLERAVDLLLARRAETPDDFRVPSALAQVYAALGMKEEALASAAEAIDAIPLSKDALVGTDILFAAAEAYATAGEDELALDTMAKLHAVPAIYRNTWWTENPAFAELADHPRFQSLVTPQR